MRREYYSRQASGTSAPNPAFPQNQPHHPNADPPPQHTPHTASPQQPPRHSFAPRNRNPPQQSQQNWAWSTKPVATPSTQPFQPSKPSQPSQPPATANPAAPALPTPTSTPASTSAPSNNWPPTLRAWVERAFASVRGKAAELTAMKALLTRTIDETKKRGALWTTNWDVMSLPNPEAEKKKAKGAKKSRWGVGGDQHETVEPPAVGQGATKGKGKHNKSKGQGKNSKSVSRNGEEFMTQEQSAEAARREARFGAQKGPGSGAWGQDISLSSLRNGQVPKSKNSKKKWGKWGAYDEFEEGETRDDDWQSGSRMKKYVKGTCQTLEKSYFRLVDIPDPSTVRPEKVLLRALARLETLVKESDQGSGGGYKSTYHYQCDQLKALRQDVQVQGLRNDTATRIYEFHARLAIEHGDMGEFNRCQTQLQELYDEGVASPARSEFAGYRILYAALHAAALQQGYSALRDLKMSIAAGLGADVGVAWCLRWCEALRAGNYHVMFRSLADDAAPHKCAALIAPHLDAIRYDALRAICACYRPTIAVDFVAHELGFVEENDGDVDAGMEECLEFMDRCGAQVTRGGVGVGVGGGTNSRPSTPVERVPPQPVPAKAAKGHPGRKRRAGQAELDDVEVNKRVKVGGITGTTTGTGTGMVMTEGGSSLLVLDCTASNGKLRVPRRPAVAHGDDKLQIDAFLAAHA